MYIPRAIEKILIDLISQFPAVLITGPRQVGKSTLLQEVAKDYSYVSFDDSLLLAQAKEEPNLFLLNYPSKVILDEVQYVPELFTSLKLAIDKSRNNGMFLLSGSQAFELMQNVSETLAGRIAILKLSGLSLREIQRSKFNLPFIPNTEYLKEREAELKNLDNLWEIIHKGYMPRLYQQEVNWHTYYSSYVSTYIERDVRQIANINSSLDFSKFMVAIAARSGELLNYNNLSKEVGVSLDTIKRWVSILQTSGIIYLLQPYANNRLKRAIKTPKVYMLDTGLMAWLTKWLTPETIQFGAKSGQFYETFVIGEIVKSFYNVGVEPSLYFYRDTNQKEIDLIIEDGMTIYPLEIKTTANPQKQMAKSFELLRNNLSKDEVIVGSGILISQYPQKLLLAENLISLPLSYI